MKSLLLTSACAFMLLPGAAWAQGQTSTAAGTGATDTASPPTEQGGIQDIIITAQRRSENLQRAAIAVTVLNSEALTKGGITDPTGLTNVVPALNVSTAAGPYALFYLRGVGNFTANALSDSAVAVNLDGVFLGRPSAVGGQFYDIARVEVLKGPQGTLYGRNATGGAVNIITQRPILGVTQGEFSASYGNYDAVQANGALNVPLGETAALRVAGQYVRHDGYMSDGTSDQKDLSGRVQLRWEPTDTLKIQIGGDYFRQRGIGAGSTVLTDGIADKRVGLGDPRSDPAVTAVYFFPAGNTYAPAARNPYMKNESWGAYANVEADVGFATWTTLASYRGSSLDFRSTVPGFLITQREKDRQFSIESRLAGNAKGPIQWIAGAYYFDEKIDVPGASFNQQVSASFQQFYPTTKSLAFFGRVTGSLTDRFRVNVGARYTTEDKKISGDFYQISLLCGGTVLLPNPTDPVANCFGAPRLPQTLVPGPIFAPNGAVIPFQPFGFGAPFPGGPATTPSFLTASTFALNRSANFERVTWRAGFEWDVMDRSLLYGAFETGFKSGGFFFTRDDPVFRPETIKAWTLGMKNRFFDNRLQLNFEAFWWTYEDQQISSTARDSANNVVFATRNIGKSTNRGFEIEAQGMVTKTTQITANLQYLDANYDNFVYSTPNNSPQIPGLVTSVPPVANCPFTLANPTTLYIQNCSGNRPPNAPEWVLSFGAQQRVPLGAWELVLNADTRYQSRIWTGLEYLPSQSQEGYWQSNASITLSAPEERYAITAFVNNIENNDIVGNSFPDPFGGANLVLGSIRPPRTYGIRAGLKF